jgi:hypothetical protein
MAGSLQQDRLEKVYTLAAKLADRILADQIKSGVLAIEDTTALWNASLLLDDYDYPVPSVVVDVLGQARQASWMGGKAA